MAELEVTKGVVQKLQTIRIAAQYEFPTAAIDGMLAEIEAGNGTTEPGPESPKIDPCKD